MTGWIELYTIPGNSIVGHPKMFGRRLLKVKREGIGYDIVTSLGALGSHTRKVMHRLDKLTFNIPFNNGEKVYVLIKNL